MPGSTVRFISLFIGATVALSLLFSWQQTRQKMNSPSEGEVLTKLATLQLRVEQLEQKNHLFEAKSMY